MAIILRSASSMSNGRKLMTLEEFKRWLKRFDSDKDGRINNEELKNAMRASRGGWFTGLKSKRGIKSADADRNGFIDDNEMGNLKMFAYKNLGINIID